MSKQTIKVVAHAIARADKIQQMQAILQKITAHFGTPHIQQALAEITSLLAQAPDIQKYTLLA